jgi:hypothetical protein
MDTGSSRAAPSSSVLGRTAAWLRRAPRPGFFDQYPRFLSMTATPGRLNERYRALISHNQEMIRDRTILDLAAHDGRWSFAALKAGARHVTGIEGRSHLVDSAIVTTGEYGIAAERYRFIVGDIFDQIDLVQTGSIDTVFCFGFFYHTPHHLMLLSKIARLSPRHLILDTEIETTTDCIVRLYKEEIARDTHSIVGLPADPIQALCGRPSRSALEMMLSGFGWTFSYYDWHSAGVTDWHDLREYKDGKRVSIAATRV